MWKLQTDMSHTDNIQNMVRANNEKLAKIMHILASNNQYGYEEGISTTDAIIQVEQ